MALEALVIDDFEHGDVSKYATNHHFVRSYRISLSDEVTKVGKMSLKLAYDFGEWLTGNGLMSIIFKEDLYTHIMPCSLGVWVYSDGRIPWLRASIIDGAGERKTVNLTDETMSWHGWRYVAAQMNETWQLPLQLEQLYAVETDKSFVGDQGCGGEFYINYLRFVYQDDEDLIGPIFSQTIPDKQAVYESDFTFSTVITDASSGVDESSITLKVNNELKEHQYCKKTGKLTYKFENVLAGNYKIVVNASDLAGNAAVPNLILPVVVDLSPDIDPPQLLSLVPVAGGIEYSNTPRITFQLVDEKSGIDQTGIGVFVNGISQVVIYDEGSGFGYVLVEQELGNGKHDLILTAKDRAGNALTTVKQHFYVKSFSKPNNADDFKISIIPDVHDVEYARMAFRKVAEEKTDFVIQMGDLVDLAYADEFLAIKKALTILNGKKMMTIPGNHESFQGNLDLYTTNFGAATYHFNYGNSLFVFLNTAYEQSISQSDPTQFTYLMAVLAKNKQKNLILVTHVPTRDRFGTSHNMKSDDASRLEQILTNYQNTHPSRTVTVLFGHLHVIDSWEKAHVNYIITGNSAAKGYVSSRQGNIRGYGLLDVHREGVRYYFKPYISALYLMEANEVVTEVELAQATLYEPNVYIEFLETTVNIMEFPLIKKTWASTNDTIAHVHESGVIHAVNCGIAYITVEVSGVQAVLKIIVK